MTNRINYYCGQLLLARQSGSRDGVKIRLRRSTGQVLRSASEAGRALFAKGGDAFGVMLAEVNTTAQSVMGAIKVWPSADRHSRCIVQMQSVP